VEPLQQPERPVGGVLGEQYPGQHQATLLVVSNRPATLARADQVITLDHGHVAQQRECA
jgi:ABC-type transport system involved in cytochrome bd biosynthesis fused ATPase/permease subunit